LAKVKPGRLANVCVRMCRLAVDVCENCTQSVPSKQRATNTNNQRNARLWRGAGNWQI